MVEQHTCEDWLDAALEIFRTHGRDGITIARLCDALHVTKGSFYHHFDSLDELLDALVKHWQEWRTHRIICGLDKDSDTVSIDARLALLTEQLVREDTARYDAAMYMWAMNFDASNAREVLRETDTERLKYGMAMWQKMGYEEKEARIRTELYTAWIIASSFGMYGLDDPKYRMEQSRAMLACLTCCPPARQAFTRRTPGR